MRFDTEMSLRLMEREEICHVGERSPEKRESPSTDKLIEDRSNG